MYRGIVYLFILASIILSGCISENRPVNDDVDRKVEILLSKMTLKEKVGQMSQIDIATFMKRVNPKGNFYGPFIEPHVLDPDSLQKYVVDYGISSIFNIGNHGYTPEEWYNYMKEIQDYAVHKTRLGIPVIYGVDAIHGSSLTVGATLFPQELGMASCWNPDLVEKAAEVTAYEMRASNLLLNFGPSLDLGKQPVWSRLNETYGEDVFLTKILSKKAIDGMEGIHNNISDTTKISTGIKHYVAYSFPISGKDRTPAWIPEYYVREYFLPPFVEGIDAGAHTIVLNSGELNGIPIHCSKYWVNDVLRNELHFKGVIISDWRDVEKLEYFHHVAPTYKEAILMAINAGIDLNMVPYDNQYMDLLIEMVNEGKISKARINQSVRRILHLKYELGLFDKPLVDPKNYTDFGSEKFRKVARQSSRESIILLKNENKVLPLSKKANVLVTGPTANTMCALNGGWTYSWQGNNADTYASEKNTILEAVQQKIGPDRVIYSKGTDYENELDIKEAVKAARNADYILLCLGEPPYAETPGYIEDLYLPDAQTKLAQAMAETGKPVILVLTEGRPRLISKFEPLMKAAVLSFLPGNEGGDAFADVLFGDFNPGGKLPVTYPRFPNNLMNYDHRFSERADHNYGYNLGYNPQYPFGFGLSYTNFTYSNLKFSKDTIGMDDQLNISVDVKNSGNLEGKEVVQLYIRDLYATLTPPYRRLRGFEKISLKPGEQKMVNFTIKPDELKYVGENNQWITEAGKFGVFIDRLGGEFYFKN